MTTTPTPDVAHRLEFSVEVPGTPEQVWQAIATAGGVTSWFMPTTVEEREGGAFITHMGETDSVGRIVRWDPPHHLSYEEPEWAALVGQDPATTTPLVTEMVVEAQSGGTCVVRVVSSAFGTGADWEGEIMADMGRMWRPFFDNLGLYLTHFPGQHARTFECSATVDGTADRLWSALSGALGLTAVGAGAQARGVSGTVERLGDDGTFIRLTDPVPGILAAAAFQMDETTSMALLRLYLFGDGAAGYVEREEAAWQAWLEGLAVTAGCGVSRSRAAASALVRGQSLRGCADRPPAAMHTSSSPRLRLVDRALPAGSPRPSARLLSRTSVHRNGGPPPTGPPTGW